VLEVLVGKTVEQSLLEVMEEEELACLQAQMRAFRELRDAELAEVQRLEEQERRRRQEKVCVERTDQDVLAVDVSVALFKPVSVSIEDESFGLSICFSFVISFSFFSPCFLFLFKN